MTPRTLAVDGMEFQSRIAPCQDKGQGEFPGQAAIAKHDSNFADGPATG